MAGANLHPGSKGCQQKALAGLDTGCVLEVAFEQWTEQERVSQVGFNGISAVMRKTVSNVKSVWMVY